MVLATTLATSREVAAGARPEAAAATPARDAFGRALRDLRISVTDRCNFRCAYCLPAEGERPVRLAPSRLLTFDQITRIAAACTALGVHKIRLTGGEPLLRRGLPRLMESLAGLDGADDLALTTNGWLLADRAPELAAAGLQRVTVSLDSLDSEVFGRVTGVGARVERVVAGIRAARSAGLAPVKLNAVMKRGVNEAGIVPLARFARDEGVTLRLIEYMDVGQANVWRPEDVVPAAEMVALVDEAFPLVPADPVPGEVATRYAYRDGGGELGVIGAVSRPFCDGCTRLRLTADGRLYLCLFAADGHDMKDVLATQPSAAQLREALAAIWCHRTDRYSALRSARGPDRDGARRASVEMYRIGG